jgi:hypothetical protein
MVPWVESGLERGGASREELGPSSEAGTHSRWCQALERGGGFVVRRLPLEQDGGSPEGCRGRLVCWAVEAFWAMGLSLPWAAAMRGVIHSCGIDRLLFLKRGHFPVIRGPIWLSPTVAPEPLQRYP